MDILFQHDADPILELPERAALCSSIRTLLATHSPEQRINEFDQSKRFDEQL